MSAEGAPRRGPAPLLAGIALLALAWRWLYLLVASRADLFHGLFLDAAHHARVAASIRAGEGAGEGPYLLSPLYPYLLALFPFVEGELATSSALGARALHAVFGAITCAAVAFVALRTGGRRLGLFAGLIAALYGPLVHHDVMLLVEGPLACSTMLALALAVAGGEEERRPRLRWLACGLSLGLAAALRPTALLIVLAFALVHLARWLRGRRALQPPRAPLASAGLLLLGAALAVAPFTARNLAVAGEPVLLSANGGLNLWIGNHRGATGLFDPPGDYDFERDPVGITLAERALERRPSTSEADAWWRARALGEIAQAPSQWLGLLADKLVLSFHPVEIPQLGNGFHWHAERARLAGLPLLRGPLDARWILLLAAASPFAVLLRGGSARLAHIRWPLAQALAGLLALLLFFVSARHRIPLMPVAIVLACLTVRELYLLAFRTRWERPVATLALFAALAAALLASVALFSEGGRYHLATTSSAEERHRGASLQAEGRHEEAIEVYRAALRERDDPTTRVALARALLAAGRPSEAIAEMTLVLRARPTDAAVHYELANLLRLASNDREAEELYRRALELRPRFPEARFNLGVVLMEARGAYDEAVEHMEHALQQAPIDAPWRRQAELALIEAQRRAARRMQPDPTGR